MLISSLHSPLLGSFGNCVLNAGASSALYFAALKTFEAFVTRPVVHGRNLNAIEIFQEACADLRDAAVNRIGARTWQRLSSVIFDNAWISIFVLSLINSFTTIGLLPLSFKALVFSIHHIMFSSAAWSTRTHLSRQFPDSWLVRSLIAPTYQMN